MIIEQTLLSMNNKKIIAIIYAFAAAVFYAIYVVVPDKMWLRLSVGTILLGGYGALIVMDLKKRKK